jgi:hypothetical protein
MMLPRRARSRESCQKSNSSATHVHILIAFDVCPGIQDRLFSKATRLLTGYPAFGLSTVAPSGQLIVSVKVDVMNGNR